MTPTTKLKEILEKAAGATGEGWAPRCVEKQILGSHDGSPARYALYATATLPIFVDDPWSWTERRFDRIKANADHIAACDPTTITAIVRELLAWREWGTDALMRIAEEPNRLGEMMADEIVEEYDLRAWDIANEALRKLAAVGRGEE